MTHVIRHTAPPLAGQRDRIYGGHCIADAGEAHGAKQYRLEPVEPGTGAPRARYIPASLAIAGDGQPG